MELGQLILRYATNLHCDTVTSVSSRKKNEVDEDESVTSFSILTFSDSVSETDSYCSSDKEEHGKGGIKINRFRVETIGKGLCLIIMHLSSLTSFSID